MRHTGSMSPNQNPRRARRIVPIAASVALTALLAMSTTAGAVSTSATQVPAGGCAGVVIDASLAAASVPGGSWTVQDACVPAEAVYETDVLGYRLVGGMGGAVYTDGHLGRVAFLTARVAPDRSLTLLGLEDSATGTISWAYADGGFTEENGTRVGGGAADSATIEGASTAGPIEPAQVNLAISGTGTDLSTAQGPIADQVRMLLDQALKVLAAG